MIPLVKTFLPPRDELMPRLERVLYSGYIAQGETVDAFEEGFGDYIGNQRVVSVNSGSSALHIALILAGVGAGDEVISTALTAEPTNTVIKQTGASIVWADIDLDTGNICPTSVRSKLTDRTKAIVVVDYAGVPVDIEAFSRIEMESGIPIIQDSAHALGAEYRGKKLGNHFGYTIFSFQSIKHLTTVDGGLLALRSQDDYERARLIRWFGLDKGVSRQDNNISLQGYKYHMNNVNAEIGLCQLRHLEQLVSRYVDNGRYFDDRLSGLAGVTTLVYPPDSCPSYWLYTIKVDDKPNFIAHMQNRGIQASDLHKRNDRHRLFEKSLCKLPNLDLFEQSWVHLPCGWWVGEGEREAIVAAIREGW